MRESNWQVASFGTFDVENYGDLLFLLIAEAELSERLGSVKLHRFSYNAKEPPEDTSPLHPYNDTGREIETRRDMSLWARFRRRFAL